jgi:hypothetical protein
MAAAEEPHVNQWRKPEHQEFAAARPAAGDRRLDRLLHHSTVVSVQGKSYRLKDKRRAGLLKAPAAARAAVAPV